VTDGHSLGAGPWVLHAGSLAPLEKARDFGMTQP